MVSLAAISYGGDFSLGHGAFVQSRVQITEDRPVLLSSSIKFAWGKKHPLSCGLDSDPLHIFKISKAITDSVASEPRGYIVLDFDARSVYWSGQKILAVKMALLTGHFAGVMEREGNSVIFTSPERIRAYFGLKKGNSAKELLIAAAATRIGNFKNTYHALLDSAGDQRKSLEETGDLADALILSAFSGYTALNMAEKVLQQQQEGKAT